MKHCKRPFIIRLEVEVLLQDIGGVKQVLVNQHIDVLFYGGMLCR